MDAVDLPIVGFGGLVSIFEINQPFSLTLLVRPSIDMPHSLNKHPQRTLILLTIDRKSMVDSS